MAKVAKAPRPKTKRVRAKSLAAAGASKPKTTKPKAKPAARSAGIQKARGSTAPASPTAKASRRAAAKPVAAPPQAKRARGRKPRKPLFDKRTLASIRQQLAVHQEELQTELEELEQAAFNVSQSEMSGEVSYDEDSADAGSFTFEREKDLSIANNVQDLIDKIHRAIAKIDAGTYGICEVCGNPIEPARLKALPHALLCVKDKAAEERR